MKDDCRCRSHSPADSADGAASADETPWTKLHGRTIRAQSVDVVLLEPIVEGALADPEQLGGALAIASDDVERMEDRLALEVGERAHLVGLRGGSQRGVL